MALVTLLVGASALSSPAGALAQFVADSLDIAGNTTVTVDLGRVSAEALVGGDTSDAEVREIVSLVEAADSVVIVTPVRRKSFSGSLKALLDLLPSGAFAGKTVMPFATGGTSSHLSALEYALHPVIADLGGRHIIPGSYVLDRDIAVHVCAVTLEPEAENAIEHALSMLTRSLDDVPSPASLDDDLIGAAQALALQRDGALLLDVRSGDMRAGRPVPAAVHVEKQDVPALFDSRAPGALMVDLDRTIVVYCSRTAGSGRVLRQLRRFGYTRLRHVEGGYAALDAALERPLVASGADGSH